MSICLHCITSIELWLDSAWVVILDRCLSGVNDDRALCWLKGIYMKVIRKFWRLESFKSQKVLKVRRLWKFWRRMGLAQTSAWFYLGDDIIDIRSNCWHISIRQADRKLIIFLWHMPFILLWCLLGYLKSFSIICQN